MSASASCVSLDNKGQSAAACVGGASTMPGSMWAPFLEDITSPLVANMLSLFCSSQASGVPQPVRVLAFLRGWGGMGGSQSHSPSLLGSVTGFVPDPLSSLIHLSAGYVPPDPDPHSRMSGVRRQAAHTHPLHVCPAGFPLARGHKGLWH